MWYGHRWHLRCSSARLVCRCMVAAARMAGCGVQMHRAWAVNMSPGVIGDAGSKGEARAAHACQISGTRTAIACKRGRQGGGRSPSAWRQHSHHNNQESCGQDTRHSCPQGQKADPSHRHRRAHYRPRCTGIMTEQHCWEEAHASSAAKLMLFAGRRCEEAAPVQARHSRAARDPEVPALHGPAHQENALCAVGARDHQRVRSGALSLDSRGPARTAGGACVQSGDATCYTSEVAGHHDPLNMQHSHGSRMLR